jgi:ABC-2 type transport system permease protein
MVLASKLLVLVGLVSVASAAGIGGALLTGRLMLPGSGFTIANDYHLITLGDGLTRRAALGTLIYLILVAVVAAGISFVVRDTGAAVACAFGRVHVGDQPPSRTARASPRSTR